jgi:uncharacterized protein (UPF0332 family)
VTEANRRQNIVDAIARAGDALRAAEALLAAGLCADAISRAYYAAFHWMRALLFALGEEPRTHAGVLHLFNRDYVRAGRLPPEWSRVLAGLQRARELADYDPVMQFAEADVRAQLGEVERFGAETERLLRADGWIA